MAGRFWVRGKWLGDCGVGKCPGDFGGEISTVSPIINLENFCTFSGLLAGLIYRQKYFSAKVNSILTSFCRNEKKIRPLFKDWFMIKTVFKETVFVETVFSCLFLSRLSLVKTVLSSDCFHSRLFWGRLIRARLFLAETVLGWDCFGFDCFGWNCFCETVFARLFSTTINKNNNKKKYHIFGGNQKYFSKLHLTRDFISALVLWFSFLTLFFRLLLTCHQQHKTFNCNHKRSVKTRHTALEAKKIGQ